MKRLFSIGAGIVWACGWASSASGAVPLVTDGVSSHTIYVDANAPGTVQTAAVELQHYFRQVTGAELEIVSDVRRPTICLGRNALSEQAGLRVEDIPVEGFRTVVRGGDVFILGPDTPDGERAPGGGISAGTRNGVYHFIERHLGVRWLMPGEHGEYLPSTTSVSLPEMDALEWPVFVNRRLPYTQERRPVVKKWWDRQKLGYSLALSHGHNWRAIKPEEFRRHPEWFAERGGVRVPPTGHYKLCQTDPELIAAFAERAIGHFRSRPDSTCYSLSPSDGGGWCECDRCTSFYETDPRGKLSVTPAVLHFYNEVAKIVGREFPDKLLAGYVYAQYVFPPREPFRLQPNLFLVWAPSFDYGFTLFRPETQELWTSLVPLWTQATENIAYYDLPNCVSNSVGAPNPPALEIVRFLYPRLKQAKMKGVYVYGNSAWGHSACMNYILAKVAWDPDADVNALFEEFCDKAYGAGGKDISAFYRLLDAETKRFFIENESASYQLSDVWLKSVYAATFPRLEELYVSALGKVVDPDARARLEMLGLNLRLLHWNLTQRGALPPEQPSQLAVSDQEYLDLLDTHEGTLALHLPAGRRRRSPAEALRATVPVETLPNASPVQPYWLRGNQELVLTPVQDGPVEMRFVARRVYGNLIWAHLFGNDGKRIRRFILNEKEPVRFDAKAGTVYVLQIDGGRAFYRVEVDGARWALSANVTDKGLHLIQQASPVYFHVPAKTASFRIWLGATPPGETAVGTLVSPSGREAARFDCTAKAIDEKEIDVQADEHGWWKLIVEDAPTGVMDDVYVHIDEPLSGYVCIDPQAALRVEPPEDE